MSKNTSPRTRSSSRRRLRGTTPVGATSPTGASRPARRPRTGTGSAETPAPDRPTSLRGRVRRFLPVVLIPDVVAILVIVALSFAGLIFTSAAMAKLPATIAELWMVTNLAPFVLDGVTVSFIPMVPALLFIAVLSRRIHQAVREKVSMIDLGVLALCMVIVPLVVTTIAWLMLWDAAKVFALSPPPLVQALVASVGVHVVALLVGMGQRLWRAIAANYGIPQQVVDGVADAWRFFKYLALAAVALLGVGLVVGWSNQAEVMASYPTISGWGIAGLIILSLLYLPNAIIAAMAVLLGSEAVIGAASMSVFSVHLVPLPPLPLFGVVPASAPVWAPVLLLVTAALASWVMVDAKPDWGRALGAGLGAALLSSIAVAFAGGGLGWYGYTGPSVWMTIALATGWLGVLGLATAAALKFSSRRSVVPSPPEEVDDTDPDDNAVVDAEFEEVKDETEQTPVAESAEDTEVVEGTIYKEHNDEADVEVSEDAEDGDVDKKDMKEEGGVDSTPAPEDNPIRPQEDKD